MRNAFKVFNAAEGGQWRVRYDGRTGLPSALVGGRTSPRPGRPEEAARAFLSSRGNLLGVEAANLALGARTNGRGHHHFLYRQQHRGIPVEFASVKIHVDARGSVIGAASSYEPGLSLTTIPALPADAAVRAAELDARGGKSSGAPELVILPLESTGRAHLAWKVKLGASGAAWRYYVDATTGQILFRYNNLRFLCATGTNGIVEGMVYDIDPNTTPGPVARRFNNQYVYTGSAASRSVTGQDPDYGQGFFCNVGNGKVAMSLQGPYVNVSEFRGPSAHYDNGGGVWSTINTPVSSPHPYLDASVHVSTIDLTGQVPANAVKFMPVFSTFKVGGFSGLNATDVAGGDITDDDQVTLSNQNGEPVASFIGDRGGFHGTAVHGKKMHITLRSNDSVSNEGYDVSISSYLVLSNPDTDAGPGASSHTWTEADVPIARSAEINLFYHLNAMHDYFFADVNRSSAAPVTRPVVAMAHVGPNLVNAFYNPDFDNLFFGDVSQTAPSDLFAVDATVSHHEYVHYLVEKIWSIQNFGQAGAISEGVADYFAASSLNRSSIGAYVCSSGRCGEGVSVLRELDSSLGGVKDLRTGGWTGEIHDDSVFLSQALWDIRRDRIQTLDADADPGTNGRSCADGLVFESLLFFPESFLEFQDAMLRVDQLGSVAACGGAGLNQGLIAGAFNTHGLILGQGDAYEPNDGFEGAVDISTLGAVTASIYPAADSDIWSFGAGAGLVQITLKLPRDGSFYKAYQLRLFDRARRLVASAAPAYNGFGTIDGTCDPSDCTTTQSEVVLNYNNPDGGLLYLQVVGGDAPSGVHSTVPYLLRADYPRVGALASSIVTASYDHDVISFNVDVSSFVTNQDWRFERAQLRDQSFQAMPNTQTNAPPAAGDYLTLLSSSNAGGSIAGRVRIATGFAARFPAVGTVYLEVFGYNVRNSTNSLGLSNPINLTASQTALTAYNNLFNPLRGEKATIKYSVASPGRLTLKLYTITGTHVLTLFDDLVPPGKGSIDWNGRNFAGSTVASGVYIVRARGPALDKTQKIVILK